MAAGNVLNEQDEVRPVTALFADIVGSTSLGEMLAPDEIKTLVGECVSRMTVAIENYGGVVHSFMGDGVAAFFGADAAREDDCVRAALAALEIANAIAGYAAQIQTAWNLPGLSVRIGLNSGRVGTGVVGGANLQRVALGDPVNVAARLQGQAEPQCVLVGEEAAIQLIGRFDLECLGPMNIRGRTAPVKVWRLHGYLGEPEVAPQAQFIGRARELAVFDRAATGALHGRGRVLLVTGEAGLGKSRLLGEFRKRVPEEFVWLQGRCSYERISRLYGPFVDILQHWLDVDQATPEVALRARVIARLQHLLGAATAATTPHLLSLLGAGLDSAMEHRLRQYSDEGRGPALRSAYLHWVATLAQQSPVALVIDDAERLDVATRWFLEDLLRLVETAPVLVVLAMREEPGTPSWDTRILALSTLAHRSDELRLDPLSDREADDLVALVDRDDALSSAVRCDIRTRAEGNPLYLEELARATIDGVGPAASGQTPWPDSLPPALERVLLARVDRVTATGRKVLQVAAVTGRRVARSVLAELLQSEPLDEALVELIRLGLIRQDGRAPDEGYAFCHGLYEDAVLSTLTPLKRKELHGMIAEALEASDQTERSLEAIAGHFVASGREEKALEYLKKASDRAVALASLVLALELLDEGRRIALRSGRTSAYREFTTDSASLLRQMGRYGDALEQWRELLTRANTNHERASVLLEIARTEFDLGDGDAALRTCVEGLALNPASPVLEAYAVLRAGIALRQDDLDQVAAVLGDRSGAFASAGAANRCDQLSLWAGYSVALGDIEAADRFAGQELAVAETADDFGRLLRAKRDVGIVHFVSGRLGDSEQALEEVFKLAFETGHAARAQEAVATLVGVRLLRGQLAAGVLLGLEAAEWVKAPYWRAAVLANLGAIERERGLADEALAVLGSCRELCGSEPETRAIDGLALVRLAALHIDKGEVDVAQEHASAAIRAEVQKGRVDVQLQARLRLVDVALLRKDTAHAVEQLECALRLGAGVDKTELPALLRAKSQVGVVTGSPGAGDDLVESLKMAESMGMKLEEARTCTALGLLDADPRSPYFRRAREIFAECGCDLGLAELREAVASLTNV